MRAGQTLLVRGGTSSVRVAAASLARAMGARVLATTHRLWPKLPARPRHLANVTG